MSEIHRYKLVVKDFEAELVPCDFGSYVEYREHVAHIKQLEQELAAALVQANVNEQSQAQQESKLHWCGTCEQNVERGCGDSACQYRYKLPPAPVSDNEQPEGGCK